MSNPSPEVKVTNPTPRREQEEYFDPEGTPIAERPPSIENEDGIRRQEPKNTESPSITENEDGIIRDEPKNTEAMLLDIPNKDREENDEDSNSDLSSLTISEQQSGYERKSNECTECCIDCIGCFGLFDACCPSTGEGFITNLGVFCGNILVGCCKC